MSWRSGMLLATLGLGVMLTVSAINAPDATDWRSNITDLRSYVSQQRNEADTLIKQRDELASQIKKLRGQSINAELSELTRQIAGMQEPAGVAEVTGPGVEVVLSDAPDAIIDEHLASKGGVVDLLIVHQQDIQAVVNAMFAGGAQAVSVMDQRITATTGILCVGNSVILHKLPYAPPYSIKAIGDSVSILKSLNSDPYLSAYQEAVTTYDLGYQVNQLAELTIPGRELNITKLVS